MSPDDPGPADEPRLPRVQQPDRRGWERIDLRALEPSPPVTVAFCGLGYQGRSHSMAGPFESAKTIIAYIALLEEIRAGGRPMIVDFEMGAYDARDRLLELGATDDEIAEINFFEPDTAATELTINGLLDKYQPTVVLIDAAAGAYDLQGLDDNMRADAEKFAKVVIRPCRKRGVATIVLDHVVKVAENRGAYAIGSERKVGGVDVALGFETKVALARGKTGVVRIRVNKDRFGYLRARGSLDVVLASDPTTHRITWTIKPSAGTDAAGDAKPEFRPTGLMGKVSRYLEAQPDPVSRNTVETNIKGKNDYVRLALDMLTHEGYITEAKGDHRARLVTSARPYREADDAPRPTSPRLALTSPRDELDDFAPRPLPLGRGEDEVGDPLEVLTDLALSNGRHDTEPPAVASDEPEAASQHDPLANLATILCADPGPEPA